MIGNDRVRFCTHCAKYVNDISKMTRRRAHKLGKTIKGSAVYSLCERPKNQWTSFRGTVDSHNQKNTKNGDNGDGRIADTDRLWLFARRIGKNRSARPSNAFEEKSCPDRADEKNKQPLPGSTAGVSPEL